MARVAATALLVLAALGLAYTIGLSLVVSDLIEQGAALFWRTSGPGSLFPIPLRPGQLAALSPASQLDAFVYQWGVKTFLIPIVDAILIIAAVIAIARLPGRP